MSPRARRLEFARAGKPLDGKTLSLELSVKGSLAHADDGDHADDDDDAPGRERRADSAARTKLVVRNLAFATTAHDVKQLFESFGELRKVRLPKRFDGRHRGFAFVDFAATRDAKAAQAALKQAHLYGRHLVIEWAENATKKTDDN